jgi:hypothetical protein
MSFSFEPASGWTSADFETAQHEAGHAIVAALWAGAHVDEVRIDRPDANVLGHLRYAMHDRPEELTPEEKRAKLRDRLTVILAGPLACGEDIQWPVFGPDGTDRGHAGSLIMLLGLTEAEVTSVIAHTKALCRLYQREIRALASALLDRGAIPGSEIFEVVQTYTRKQAKPVADHPAHTQEVDE